MQANEYIARVRPSPVELTRSIMRRAFVRVLRLRCRRAMRAPRIVEALAWNDNWSSKADEIFAIWAVMRPTMAAASGMDASTALACWRT